ncbi:MAG: enoyl-CoA hydratase-related protein [Myxococcales bacterium]
MGTTMETGTDHLLAEAAGDGGRVAVLTLNRPERRNALSQEMLEALARVLDACERDPAIRCIVLTGVGAAFCAGGDVKDMDAEGQGESARPAFDARLAGQRRSQRETVARIYRMPKPVIAALPGAAAGAGMGLCMACDLRLAADTAIMTTAFARVGFSGDYGLPWLLAQQVGRTLALELFYFSEKLSAERCEALGLVNRVVPASELHEKTMELANRLAAGPAVALGYIKENVNAAFSTPLEEYMDAEVMRHLTTARTDDHREAARAFVEKREPRFEGR